MYVNHKTHRLRYTIALIQVPATSWIAIFDLQIWPRTTSSMASIKIATKSLIVTLQNGQCKMCQKLFPINILLTKENCQNKHMICHIFDINIIVFMFAFWPHSSWNANSIHIACFFVWVGFAITLQNTFCWEKIFYGQRL